MRKKTYVLRKIESLIRSFFSPIYDKLRLLTVVMVGFLLMSDGFFCNKVDKPTEPTEQEKMYLYPFGGIDELGRELPTNQDVGGLKKNRQVGVFYFLWQGDKGSKTSELYWDLNKIIPMNPDVLENFNHPGWGPNKEVGYYYWGEPIYGYYRGDDYWVHLRSIQLLTDANVDFLVIDATNKIIYIEQSAALMKAIVAVQAQGKTPPKIVYYTNTASGETMQNIYDTFYKKTGALHYYPSSWYYLDGKPLIIGVSKEAETKSYQSFFTFRESQWPNEPIKTNGWPWIDFNRPQTVYSNHKGEREIINVSVAQHPNPTVGMGGSAFYGNTENWGRSYRKGSHGNPANDILYGYNVQEQWDHALNQNVPFIFITGWNEWIAGRWSSTDGDPNHSYFCDQATPEYSRDIEPTKTANLRDNYYMQMVVNIRRYKGVSDLPEASKAKTIKSFKDWNNVKPVYIDYIGDTKHRNHPGAESSPSMVYINNTGRNDFYIMKVARSQDKIYFYAETTRDITSEITSNWMRLYIKTDRNNNSGWHGYNFRTDKGVALQKYTNGEWANVGEIKMELEGNKLFYTIPAELMNVHVEKLDLEFKWSDNMQDDNPMDWYVNGDVAPGGRFNYIYRN